MTASKYDSDFTGVRKTSQMQLFEVVIYLMLGETFLFFTHKHFLSVLMLSNYCVDFDSRVSNRVF